MYPSYPQMYSLGDYGTEGQMSTFNALDIKILSVGDFAFVKRSNQKWQYSMVIEASDGASTEPYIRFKLNFQGFTKKVPITLWATYIRLLSKNECTVKSSTRKVSLAGDTEREKHVYRRVSWAGELEQDIQPKNNIKPVVAPKKSVGRRRRVSCCGSYLSSDTQTTSFLSALASINHNSSFHTQSP